MRDAKGATETTGDNRDNRVCIGATATNNWIAANNITYKHAINKIFPVP